MAGTPQFVDVSAFQGTIDWPAYKTWAAQWDGFSRVAMKATEGIGYTDPRFTANKSGAIAAGIDAIAFYHFARPDLGNNAANEASYMHSVVGELRSFDAIMLDFEVAAPQATAEWAYEWLQTAQSLWGRLPGIYASSSYIQQHLQDQRLASFDLWLANWQYSPNERPPVPPPWQSYYFVQYTDRASGIPGIPGDVDANIFLGAEPMNRTTYGPQSADFKQWFTEGPDGNWTCVQTHAVLMGANKALYSQLSIDGNTLPVIGLPLSNEQYQIDSDGYHWSKQPCERAEIWYDPEHKHDGQPGLGASYLSHTEVRVLEKIPDNIIADIKALKAATGKLATDAGV